ncbi:MAG TPA: hypothetical protein VGF77_13640 [Allosphingosinicella sp.]
MRLFLPALGALLAAAMSDAAAEFPCQARRAAILMSRLSREKP